jgi:hypothetical protein
MRVVQKKRPRHPELAEKKIFKTATDIEYLICIYIGGFNLKQKEGRERGQRNKSKSQDKILKKKNKSNF